MDARRKSQVNSIINIIMSGKSVLVVAADDGRRQDMMRDVMVMASPGYEFFRSGRGNFIRSSGVGTGFAHFVTSDRNIDVRGMEYHGGIADEGVQLDEVMKSRIRL